MNETINGEIVRQLNNIFFYWEYTIDKDSTLDSFVISLKDPKLTSSRLGELQASFNINKIQANCNFKTLEITLTKRSDV